MTAWDAINTAGFWVTLGVLAFVFSAGLLFGRMSK